MKGYYKNKQPHISNTNIIHNDFIVVQDNAMSSLFLNREASTNSKGNCRSQIRSSK